MIVNRFFNLGERNKNTKILKIKDMKKVIRTKDMSKKGYNKPKMRIVKLQHEAHLLSASCVAPSANKWTGEIG